MARVFLMSLALCVVLGLIIDNPHVINMSSLSSDNDVKDPDFLSLHLIVNEETTSLALVEVLEKIIDRYYMYMKVYVVQCTPELCKEDIVKLLPSFSAYVPAGVNPYTSEPMINQKGYEGAIDYNKILEFVTGNIPYLGEILDSGNLEEFLSETGNKCVLFTDKDKPPLLFKRLSSVYRSRMEFGIVYSKQQELLEKYEITEFPTLIVVNQAKYQGNIDFIEISTFLEPFLLETKKPLKGKNKIKPEPQKSPVENIKLPEFKVPGLTRTSYGSILNAQSKLTLIHFYQEKEVAEWEEILSSYNGMLQLYTFKVATDEDTEFATELGIKRFPSLRLSPINRKRKQFELSFTNKSELEEILSRELKGDITTVFDSSFQLFSELASVDNKLACLYLSDQPMPVAFKALAADPSFIDFVKFGYYNKEEALTKKAFNTKQFPTVLTFLWESDTEKTQLLEYNGKLEDYRTLYYFLDSMALPYFLKTEREIEESEMEEITEFTTRNFNNACIRKGSICVIGLFEGEPETTSPHYKILKKVQAKMESKGISAAFGWMDGICQYEIREKMGISEVALPNIAVYIPRKSLGSRLIGKFTELDVTEFIQNVIRGKSDIFEYLDFAVADRDCEEFMESLHFEDTVDDELLREVLREHQRSENTGETKKKPRRKKKKKSKDDL